MLLFAASIPVLAFSVFYMPYATFNLLAPPATVAPTPPNPGASAPEYQLYNQRLDAYNEEEHNQKLIPLQVLLDVLVCGAFFFGIIRPMRPTLIGLIMTAGGIVGLIILTGTLALPSRPALFVVCAIVEALLLIPIVLLLTSEET
jgi:hypothetical protein